VSGTVRASTVITWVRAAWVIQVLLPFRVQSPLSSFTAFVRRLPRSEPVLGSVNTAVGRISPDAIRAAISAFCSSVPPHRISSAAISERVPSDADTDIAAAKLLGDDAMDAFDRPKPPMFLGDGQAEDAHLGHLLDHFHRDQFVLEVPFMGLGDHAFDGVPAELLADHLHLVVETGGAETRHPLLLFQQLRQPHPRRGGIALAAQSGHFGRVEQGGIHAQIGRAHDLALAHRQAAGKLGDVFAKGDLVDQRLDLAEPALGRQPLGPALHLAQALGIGRDPGQAMGGILMRLDQPAADPVALGDLRAHRRGRRPGIGLDGAKRRPGQVEQSRQQGACGVGGAVLSVMRHGAAPFLGECCAAYRMLADAAQSSHPRGGRHER
jgi:hypothetical protein